MEDDDKYFPFPELEYLAATSTGYLEDALFSKRRRLLIPYHDHNSTKSQYEWEKSAQNFHGVNPPEVHHQVGEISSSSAASTEPDLDYSSSSSGRYYNDVVRSQYSSRHDGDNIIAGTKSVSNRDQYYSCNSPATATHRHFPWVGRGTEIKEEDAGDEERKQEKISTGGGGRRIIKRRRVAYPFAMVKPGGGEEGVVTIEEINSRLMMAPTRPLRHPVGDFACRPCVSAAGRPGLSGKAVIALTKIYTQGGKGTVTIIRTKG